MDAATRRFVISRAQERCEYCRLPQHATIYLTFHIEHVYAQQHVQNNSRDNLSLACPDCNRHKGPNLSTIDASTGQIVRLYHPRRDSWSEHFELVGLLILGRTDIGIATCRLLQFNAPERIEVRAALISGDEY